MIFFCLNCLHSFVTENKLESHKKVCENKDFCNNVVSFQDSKILEFNQYHKYDKASFITYLDLECLIEEFEGCENNPENSSTTKVGEHMPRISSLKSIEISTKYTEVKTA